MHACFHVLTVAVAVTDCTHDDDDGINNKATLAAVTRVPSSTLSCSPCKIAAHAARLPNATFAFGCVQACWSLYAELLLVDCQVPRASSRMSVRDQR